jgi:hypothetical protein
MKQRHPLKHGYRLSYLVLDICGRTKFERKTEGSPSCQPACSLFLFNFAMEIFIRICLVIIISFPESQIQVLTPGRECEG